MWSLVPIDDWIQLGVLIFLLLILLFFTLRSERDSSQRRGLAVLCVAAGVYVLVWFGGLVVGARRLDNFQHQVAGWCDPHSPSFNPDKCSAAVNGRR